MNSQSDEIKRKIVPILKNYGVRKAALFGSIVRGKVTEKSDIKKKYLVNRKEFYKTFRGVKGESVIRRTEIVGDLG